MEDESETEEIDKQHFTPVRRLLFNFGLSQVTG
jgi:hypothetical protein